MELISGLRLLKVGFWLSSLAAVVSCVTGVIGGGSAEGPAPEATGPRVAFEIAGTVEWDPDFATREGVGFAFRSSLDLARNQKATLRPLSDSADELAPLDDTISENAHSEFEVDVTPLEIDETTVIFLVQLVRRAANGSREILTEPKLVAPYGQASEVRELNPQPGSQFARLQISVLPRQPLR